MGDLPFTMALAAVVYRCRLSDRWWRPSRGGANDVTTVRGALGDAIGATPAFAALADVFKPRSKLYPGQVSPAWLVRPSVSQDRRWMDVRMMGWGRAAGCVPALGEALEVVGEIGLDGPGGRTTFQVEGEVPGFSGTVGEWIDATLGGVAPEAMEVEFTTPCDAPAIRVSELAANAAFHLARLDVVEREAEIGDSEAEKARVEGLREVVRGAFAGVAEEANGLRRVRRGMRRSGENGRWFPLTGVEGRVVLLGALAGAMPWLGVLSLWGAGVRRSMGLGDVRLWVGPTMNVAMEREHG